jgi:small nuclear ribonucleoprotein D2
MVLENVKEMWTEKPKGGKGRGVNKDRFISKMFVSPASLVDEFVYGVC